ncbi:MAG: peptide chain release factor N(5)-glutamine methyltransferase [Clostridia bacterium]|nr:peptide chain release factor N(5)-glutamine methyltransferase [Clostridia bacterium]
MTYAELKRALRLSLSDAAQQSGLSIDCVYEADEILRLRAGMDRAAVIMHSARDVPDDAAQQCLDTARRRAFGTPLGHLLGCSPFFGHDFFVSGGCLIPRADTEVIVEEVLRLLPAGGVLWDLCTGSGCIPLSVLAEREDVSAWALELYPQAYAAAEENRRRFGAVGERLHLCRGDIFLGDSPADSPPPNVISANPPYIPTDVCKTLDAQVKAEPITALDGGEDGLAFYRAILCHYLPRLAPRGCIVLEIGCDQGEQLRALAREHGCSCQLRRDWGGNDRAAILFRLTEKAPS